MPVLTPEQLGHEGEGAFASLCNRAGLNANKSDKDAFGWDFIVETLDAGRTGAPLDKRAKQSARVQVKCSAARSSVKMSLSSAERLAKDPIPAFIVYFKMTEDGTPVRGHLIHLLDGNLARILKRLRMAHARDQYDINDQTISFDPVRMGTVFDLTPEGLKSALAAAWGSDPLDYGERKVAQLKTLGYEDGGTIAEVLAKVENEDHFARILMGVEPLKIETYTAFDVRFGIALPDEAAELFENAELYLTPEKFDTCVVTVRRTGMPTPAVFEMEASFPWIAAGIFNSTILLKHPAFHMRLTPEMEFNFETENLFVTKRGLDEWIKLLNLLVCMSGPSRIRLEFAKMGRFDLPTAIQTSGMSGPYTDQLPRILQFLRGWRELAEMAGVDTTVPFDFDDVWSGNAASLAVELGKPDCQAKFTWSPQAFGDLPMPETGLLYFRFSFLGSSLFVAAQAWIETVDGEPVSSRFKIVDVRAAEDDLEVYADEIADEHGIAKLLDATLAANPQITGQNTSAPGPNGRERLGYQT